MRWAMGLETIRKHYIGKEIDHSETPDLERRNRVYL